MEKFVYLFSELTDAEDFVGGDWDAVRGLLGGKGANLADMTRLGVPVPPGFTATTRVCNTYLEGGGEFPDDFWDQELAALAVLEEETGKRFGDPADPLLVSCRSGAKFSMPGMMDTVLNLGLNDDSTEGVAISTGDPCFAYDLYRRLLQMFGGVVLLINDHQFERVIRKQRERAGVSRDADLTADDCKEVVEAFKGVIRTFSGQDFPADPLEQLRRSTEAVFSSWHSRRAIDYRRAAGVESAGVTPPALPCVTRWSRAACPALPSGSPSRVLPPPTRRWPTDRTKGPFGTTLPLRP